MAKDPPDADDIYLASKPSIHNAILLRRQAIPEEIASAVLFLASLDSSYIIGTDIAVDGGGFSSAPNLINARRNHMMTLLKRRHALEKFLNRFKKG